MTIKLSTRNCLTCGEQLKGRSDKKFCGDECRSAFNNERNRDKNNLMRRINKILRSNRQILLELHKCGTIRIQKHKLLELGYKFNYYTNTFQTKRGNCYQFCYELGILPIEDEKYFAIVRRKKYVDM